MAAHATLRSSKFLLARRVPKLWRSQSTRRNRRSQLMSTQQESTTAQQTVSANEYTFTHDEGATLIVFFPNRPGPILLGQPATGPNLPTRALRAVSYSSAIKLRSKTGR